MRKRRIYTKEQRAVLSETMRRTMTRHGGTANGKETREFTAWRRMKDRCYQPSSVSYKYYGAKGIKVCRRWLHSFENFLADMGPRPEGTSLDRKKNHLGYSLRNCRWATRLQQSNNTTANRFVSAFGKTKTLAEWERLNGITRGLASDRIKRGWDPILAVSVQSLAFGQKLKNQQSAPTQTEMALA